MQLKLIDQNFDPKLFNKFAVNPVQSWQWGEAKRELGISVERIGEFEKEDLKHVFQITFHKIPYTNFTIGYLPRSEFPSDEVLDYISVIAKKHHAIFIKLEPYVKKNDYKIEVSKKLVSSPHPLFPSWTQMLDISKSEDELSRNLKSKTRYNIRLAQKKGVVVKEVSTDQGFEEFAKLYFETTKRQKYHGHNEHYHRVVWDHMKNGIAHILTASYENTPLAAYELFIFNDVLYYPYGGTSDLHRNLMASNLIMWEAIRLGKKLGARLFDMWGSLPSSYDDKNPWAGFTKFKEGYSTEFVEFIGSYDLILKPAHYAFYNQLHRLRSLLI